MDIGERAFVDNFDCADQKHVKWLQRLTVKVMSKISNGQQCDLLGEINDNPMKDAVLPKDQLLNWAQLHFVISMKYSTAVLQGNAWTPIQNTREE